jgi:very-short-patch-repair endonuclease
VVLDIRICNDVWMKHVDDRLLGFAKTMRRAPVANERALWKLLRDRRLEGLKFRRQVPLGRYIADFVCYEQQLIVEADGPTHLDNPRDRERDAWLRAQGFRVLRFENRQIEQEPYRVLDVIAAAANLLLPSREKVAEGRMRGSRRRAPS